MLDVSVCRTLSLPQNGWRVLWTGLKCSERLVSILAGGQGAGTDIYDIRAPLIYGSLALQRRGGRSRGDVPYEKNARRSI